MSVLCITLPNMVYPRFAARQRQRRPTAWMLSLIAGGLAVYGLWDHLSPGRNLIATWFFMAARRAAQ